MTLISADPADSREKRGECVREEGQEASCKFKTTGVRNQGTKGARG
jgi:hypothetical protein